MNRKIHIDKTYALDIMINIIVLLIVFILPEVIFNTAMEQRHRHPQHIAVYIHALTYLFIFYLNYFVLIDKMLFRKKVLIYITTAILLSAVMVIITPILHQFAAPYRPQQSTEQELKPEKIFIISMMLRDFAMMILTTGLSVALKMGLRWNKIEAQNKQIKSEQKEMELENLKSQLNPHFLFNTLNNIYALIAINQDKAQDAVHRLSKMLRYMLYADKKEVALEEELQFLRNFIELMKLRLNSSNRLTVHFPENGTEGLTIAPLLLITLVENAFKHGISGSKPSEIKINVTINGHIITLYVENSLFPKPDDKTSSGIGITNMQRRLALLYPGSYNFRHDNTGNKYTAILSIDLCKPKI